MINDLAHPSGPENNNKTAIVSLAAAQVPANSTTAWFYVSDRSIGVMKSAPSITCGRASGARLAITSFTPSMETISGDPPNQHEKYRPTDALRTVPRIMARSHCAAPGAKGPSSAARRNRAGFS